MKRFFQVIFMLLIFSPLTGFAGSSLFGVRSHVLGEFQYPFSAAAAGRGGVTMAFTDSTEINHFNFALWNSIARSSISLNLRYQNLSSETNTDDINSANVNFQGGFLVLPLQEKKLALGFGLIPYLQNDIRLQITQTGQGTAPIQTVTISGNVSQAHFGMAYKFTEALSVGVSTNYTFGLISDQYDIDYSEAGFGDTFLENRYQIYGFGFGIHTFYNISPKWSAGLTLKLPSELTMFTEQISINTEKTIPQDRKITIPLHLGTGLSYKISPRWKSGMDIHYQRWKNGYRIENEKVPDMEDSYRIGIGVEREASLRRFTSYGDNINWRFGFFMGRINTLAAGESVNEYGLGAGIGLPIIKNRNRFDISLEIGKRGALDVNDRSEVYFRVNFELSTNELWFVREER